MNASPNVLLSLCVKLVWNEKKKKQLKKIAQGSHMRGHIAI